METKEVVREKKFAGIEKSVIVEPIVRLSRSGLVDTVDHEAAFLFGNSTNQYVLPLDMQGNLISPFENEEEQLWLEEQLDLDLNYHRTKDNFWHKFKVVLDKNKRVLKLTNPKDYLVWLVLKANRLFIAPSGEEKFDKATYKYVLLDEAFASKETTKKADLNMEAYMLFGKMEDDYEKMMNFLKVFGKKVAKGTKQQFLKAEIAKIISEDPEAFLNVAKDGENYEMKLFIVECTECGVIRKNGRQYSLEGGDLLAETGEIATLNNAVKYLNAISNQELLLVLKARLEAAKDK